MEVVFGDAVVFSHMPLRLVPEVLDPVDVVPLVREQLGVVDPQVMEIRDVERVVACQAIRVDDAIRHRLVSSTAGQAFLADLEELLRLAVIQVPVDAFLTTKLGDAILALIPKVLNIDS